MQKPTAPITNLKLERMKRHITQHRLGELLGVSQGYIYKIEKLIEFPSMKRQKQLEEIFKLPIKYLLSVAVAIETFTGDA